MNTNPPSVPAPAPPARPLRSGDTGAIELLRSMVSIPSLSGAEGVLALDLTSRMAELGFRTDIDEAGNAVGSIGDPGSPRSIVLLGHMDTVPGDIPVRIEHGVLHGRGAVDAKGPLAAFIIAAASAALPPGVRIDVVGAVEEESASSRGARFIAQRPAPAACIIGEPSAWDGVTLGYKGRLLADCSVRQSSAHSAGPSPTAADRALEWWNAVLRRLETLNAGHDRVFERVQAGVRSMSTTSDGLEDGADLTAGFRLPPGMSPEELEAACRSVASEGVGLAFRGHEHAHVADRSNAVVRALSTAIRRQGGKPTPLLKTGTSDMNVVGPAWRCPIAAYGPGDSALDHAPDERISLDEYLRACRVLAGALEILASELVAGS